MHVLVTGASGLVGAALTRALVARGDDVTGISRNPETQPSNGIAWTRWSGLAEAVAGADAVVHLAGADVVAQRWSSARKQELRSSRIDTAAQIARTIRETADKPRVFVSASAVGYYGSRGDEQLTEDATPGSDFLARLCQDWEAAAQSSGIRTVVLRTGVVLAREGGALPKLLRPFRLGLGGPIGRGRHYMAWVHIADVTGVILHAIDNESVEGPLNLTAPESVTNAAFSKALGGALHRPALLRLPPLALRLQLGEGVSVLTASQRALPQRTEASGYRFRFPTLAGAFEDLLA